MVKPYEHRFPWTLDWNLLRTFMVIVQQGGVTKAATVLGLKPADDFQCLETA